MDIELKQNLARIIRKLEGQGMKPIKIAQAIGYAATRQLETTIDGKSGLSIKAVRGLINNLHVNPIFLFTGKGDMFLTDESEVETLRRGNQELIQKQNEILKTVMILNEIIKKLEKKNDDLIEISSAAIKYQKAQKQEGEKTEDLDMEGLLKSMPEIENLGLRYRLIKDAFIGLNEPESTVKNESESSLKQRKK
jgi:hypothetical protein